jgi:N-formylglutamate amidohydrolase
VVTVLIAVTGENDVTIGARIGATIAALLQAVAVAVLLQEGAWSWTRTPPYYTVG